jgi:hypothetical protein
MTDLVKILKATRKRIIDPARSTQGALAPKTDGNARSANPRNANIQAG